MDFVCALVITGETLGMLAHLQADSRIINGGKRVFLVVPGSYDT